MSHKSNRLTFVCLQYKTNKFQHQEKNFDFSLIFFSENSLYIMRAKIRLSPLEDLESKISESPATYNWPCRNPRSVSAGASRFWREDTAVTAVERPQRRERWRGTHTSSEGSAIMIRTVAMLSRRRRYCQQCGTGSGSCFQQPGRWFALVCPGSSVE